MELLRRHLKIALAARGTNIVALAKEIGCTPGAIHNCVSGLSRSARTKQAIVDTLRCDDLFPGFKVSARRVAIQAGSLVRWPTSAMTAEFLREIGPAAVEWRFDVASSPPAIDSTNVDEASAPRGDSNVITFWSSNLEPDAVAEAEALAIRQPVPAESISTASVARTSQRRSTR